MVCSEWWENDNTYWNMTPPLTYLKLLLPSWKGLVSNHQMQSLGHSSMRQCWLVVFDVFFSLVSALSSLPDFFDFSLCPLFLSPRCTSWDLLGLCPWPCPSTESVLTKCLFYVNFDLQTSYHLMLIPCHQNKIAAINKVQTRKIWFTNYKSLEMMSNRKKHF